MNNVALSFRGYLQKELLNRCKRNSGYSLRSFARALDISPSTLSRVLRGQRPVSLAMKHRLGRRLGLTAQELETLAVEAAPALDWTQVAKAEFKSIDEDRFEAISDWYHYAILELVQLRDFKPEARWIARKLSIPQAEAQAAVERLFRLGMLIRVSEGGWAPASSFNTNYVDDVTLSAAARKLQRQILEGAQRALEEIPISRRDQSSLTLSLDSRRLPEAIELITEFRRRFSRLLQKEGDARDSVYQLSISLYPVTPVPQTKGKSQ